MIAISGFWLCWTRAAAARIEAIADDIVVIVARATPLR